MSFVEHHLNKFNEFCKGENQKIGVQPKINNNFPLTDKFGRVHTKTNNLTLEDVLADDEKSQTEDHPPELQPTPADFSQARDVTLEVPRKVRRVIPATKVLPHIEKKEFESILDDESALNLFTKQMKKPVLPTSVTVEKK